MSRAPWILALAACGLVGCSQEVPTVKPAPAAVESGAQVAAAPPPQAPAEVDPKVKRAELEERVAQRKVELLVVSPRTFRACESREGAIAAKVNWDATPVDVASIAILVESPGNAPKLWLEAGATGSESTGPWVSDQTRFTLSDLESRAVLAEVVVTSTPCK